MQIALAEHNSSINQTTAWVRALKGLSAKQISALEIRLKHATFNVGHKLFEQSGQSRASFILVTGKVKLTHASSNGGEYLQRVAVPGDVVGLSEVVTRQPFFCSAVAISPSDVLTLDAQVLFEHVESCPRFSANLNQMLAAEAINSLKRAAYLIYPPAFRLVNSLLEIAQDDLRTPNKRHAATSLNYKDLASMIGVSNGWSSSALGKLAAIGVVHIDAGKIQIRDLAQLKALAQRMELTPNIGFTGD